MKFFKNKIFLAILAWIFFLFSLQFYFISNSFKRDTNSYVMLLEGSATLATSGEKKILQLNKKEKITNGDVVNTLSKSLAVIEWGDKSITRLWENTRVVIKENFVSDDLSKMNISFELLKWKTWSNVISIFSWDSYFKQEIKWVSAAVRGTVFEANYDNEYMLVHKHALKLTNQQWETKEIYPWQAFSLKTFSIEDLKQVIDETFQQINEQLDDEYLKKLRENILLSLKESSPLNIIEKLSSENKALRILLDENPKQNFEDFLWDLTPEKKQKVLSYLNTIGQSINFENGEDPLLYNLKLNTRETLVENSTDDQYKETLVRYTMYDLADLVNFEDFNKDIFSSTLGFLNANKAYVNEESSYTKAISDILLLNGENINLDSLKEKISNLDSLWQDVIHSSLDKALDFLNK